MSNYPGQRSSPEASSHTPTTGTRTPQRSLVIYFSLVLGISWLAPMTFLLYANLSERDIGAAAWCPPGSCAIISYILGTGDTTDSLRVKRDKANHNLIGALQFAAKALEVWFVYVATSLVYLMACKLDNREGGLPMGYMLKYLDYADLRTLFNLVFYRIPRPARNETPTGIVTRSRSQNLHFFTALAVLMCIIANLMGPSTAVLMIPTLQDRETPKIAVEQFDRLLSERPPAGPDAIPGCTATELLRKNYSCSRIHHGSDLNALITSNTMELNKWYDGLVLAEKANVTGKVWKVGSPEVAVEGILPFKFNASSESYGLWALSRQTLRSLSLDLNGLASVLVGDAVTNRTYTERYQPYNNSYSITLQRQGPVISVDAYSSYCNLSTIIVDKQRSISCYPGYDYDKPNETVCFRTGRGWNETNAIETFNVINAENDTDQTLIRLYWSDRSIYLENGTSNPCFRNDTAPEHCNYDTLFDPADFAEDSFIIEVSLPRSQGFDVYVGMFFLSYSFATYTFDATTLFPDLSVVTVPSISHPDAPFPMAFHPAWALAAWGVDPSKEITTARQTANLLYQSLQQISEDDNHTVRLESVIQYTMLQASTLVPFKSNQTEPHRVKHHSLEGEHPLFCINIKRQVWGWGLNSRTSYLGVVVGILGCLTVIARTYLLLKTREREPTSTEILEGKFQYNR